MKSTRRNGFALLEMLAVVAALVVIMALTVRPLRTLVADIPRSSRDFQTWQQSRDLRLRLKADVERSRQMQMLVEDDAPVLVLDGPDGTVRYRLGGGQARRRSAIAGDAAETVWTLPHFDVRLRLWRQDGRPYALEVHTACRRTVLGQAQTNYSQSHVYFQKTEGLVP